MTTPLELACLWKGDTSDSVCVAFDGSSAWLHGIRRDIETLPILRRTGHPDVVIADHPSTATWCFALNGRQLGPDLAGFFYHAYAGRQAIELSLHSPEGEEGMLRIMPILGIHWKEQHATAIEAASALLTLALMRRCGIAMSPRGPAVTLGPPHRAPRSLEINWFRTKKLLRSLYLKLPGTGLPGKWRIAIHTSPDGSIPKSGWQWLKGFKSRESADPFLVTDEGRQWLFFEDQISPAGRGRLAVSPASDLVSEPKVILERPYHLSYPCVFRHDDQWWMIPESAENSTVDLYRSSAFPFGWVHVKTLVIGPRLVDTTPFFYEGKWYFFTTAMLPGRAILSLLFWSDSLDGAWNPHPANPITGDAACARSAGPICAWNGRLIRPVQDCLLTYGRAMTLLEILELSPKAFRQRVVSGIEPDWSPGLKGTHTFCPDGGALAMDGLA